MALPTRSAYPMPTAADLPAGRVGWRVDPARAVLLVHDMQRYFLEPFADGSPRTELLANTVALRAACVAAGLPVVYTAQPGGQRSADRALLTDFWGPGLPDDPARTAIVDELAPGPADTVLTKWRYSAFQRTRLAELLSDGGRDQVIVTGVYGHIGVLSTCAEAFMRDVRPFLVADAIADFTEQDHRMTLHWVAGRCGVVRGTTELIHQLSDPDQSNEGAR